MARPYNGKEKRCTLCKTKFYAPKCRSVQRYCSLGCAREDSKKLRTGKKNPNWKGIKGRYAYSNIHKHIKRLYGKATRCENLQCGQTSKVFEWANIDGKYERDRKHYAQLCRSCHVGFDRYKKTITINETTITKNEAGNKYKSLLQNVCKKK